MSYEIDFIGIPTGRKDATAICMRWKNPYGSCTVGVVDGGFEEHGNRMMDLIKKHYFSPDCNKKYIDFIICSHPHKDHTEGLQVILQNFCVKILYMNIPWNFTSTLYPCVKNIYKTEKILSEYLKEKYSHILKLEEIANTRKTKICNIFQGTFIEDKILVLSPSKKFYLDLLKESMIRKDNIEILEHTKKAALSSIEEVWEKDALKENVKTEPDNETSTVLLGCMEEYFSTNSEYFLLTGDAGIRALEEAYQYGRAIKNDLASIVTLYEIPHHGSRHNISPSLLNKLVGNIVKRGNKRQKTAIACTGKDSEHPNQMVVNAFIRRGVEVLNTSGTIISRRSNNTQSRHRYNKTPSMYFQPEVKGW